MSNNSSKLVLQQVRESYRFLFEYQSRILNLMSFFEKRFGVTYSGGFSKFSNPPPRNGKGNLNLWAWDWLNLYYYEFHFGFYNDALKQIPFKRDKEGEDIFGLSIFLLSDDGYFQNNLAVTSNSDRVNLDSFKSVEESKTRLIFVASKNMWDASWWHCPENDNSMHKDLIVNDFGFKLDGSNNSMIFRSFDLEKFIDEDSTLLCLKEFENDCFSNNIIFKVLDNQFQSAYQ